MHLSIMNVSIKHVSMMFVSIMHVSMIQDSDSDAYICHARMNLDAVARMHDGCTHDANIYAMTVERLKICLTSFG